ncbi:DUF2141 domain-containing protein [Sphingomonas sp. MA1305]|jgi:uncharacterized protein (DUF2141 family)|uniref:DUF2141 domain-containing protein n=1 Tax=unclassified Sphingomonas TaxID=196159 RepID=UPI0018DF3426|nr:MULTISPECIES: DUF2141 domain-containing protein [unclassified Sphingomonas]MBI0476989.1 DUF2141 domain-containing protein [Sphingomonas sp. MA1305]MCP4025511.1 DUF2141 domain-containing protein [Sphingomonas sp.]
MLPLTLIALQAGSNLDLGKAAGACRPSEPGPALMVEAVGLRDRTGLLKLEVYPATDEDFLADDSHLVAEGKTFRRVEAVIPRSGPVRLCVRLPHAGRYAVSLLHDRNSDHRFNVSGDGIGFAGNPRLGWSKPKARSVSVDAGGGITPIRVLINYRHGLAMRPDAR